VEVHRARRAIAPEDQRPRIVPENRRRDAAEVHERGRDALTPIVLALLEKGFYKSTAG
jgi:hypothetical protein